MPVPCPLPLPPSPGLGVGVPLWVLEGAGEREVAPEADGVRVAVGVKVLDREPLGE